MNWVLVLSVAVGVTTGLLVTAGLIYLIYIVSEYRAKKHQQQQEVPWSTLTQRNATILAEFIQDTDLRFSEVVLRLDLLEDEAEGQSQKSVRPPSSLTRYDRINEENG